MAESKFFRVAVEGATTDGREITRDWLRQMAATYNRDKYGARIFVEHIRGLAPDGPFRAMGDVTQVKAEEIADGELKGKLALFVKIDPTPEMVHLIKSRQKIYTSIEVDPQFSDTKLAYLTGLGVTDSPASLGTEVLAFAAQHPDTNPFAARKQKPENLFTAAQETTIELEPDPADPAAAGANESRLFAKFAELLEKLAGKKPEAAPAAPVVTPAVTPAAAPQLAEFAAAFNEGIKAFTAAQQALQGKVDAITADLASAKQAIAQQFAALDATPAGAARPPATGGNGATVTDC